MKKSKKQHLKNDLSRNELLAVERTKLANERTLLAYIRTSLAAFGGGISLIQFFEYPLFVIMGYFIIPIGFLILILGSMKYVNSNKEINRIINLILDIE